MRVFVLIKQVPDTETRIKLTADQQNVDQAGIKWIINPYDEFAIEEAIRFKEKNADTQVTAVTVGPKSRVNNALLTAMAMGADDSLLIDTEENLDSLATAKTLAAAIKKQGDLHIVFCGKLAIDGNSSAVGPMVAEFLNIPSASIVSKIDYDGSNITVEREVEGGSKEIFKLEFPALVTANKGLNKPRFASLPGIMKAKKKTVETVTLEELEIDPKKSKIKFTNFALPKESADCQFLEGDPQSQVDQLISKLQDEAKVL